MPGFNIDAAKSAGYSDAEIQQYLQSQVSGGPQSQIRVTPGNPYAPPENSPLRGMGEGDQVLAGVGRGMVHTANSVGNLVGLVPDSTLQTQKEIDAPLLSTGAGRFGNIAGEAAVTAPLGMGAGALAGRAVPLLSGPLAQGVIQGGVQGAATADPGERAKQALVGALTGGTMAAGGKAVNTAVNGMTRTPEAQMLLDRGVSLTPGQMNPGGISNQMEQAMEHVWGVGPMVKNVRDNAEHQWQAAAIQEGAVPGTKITPSENLHEMLQQAQDSYAPLYDQAKGFPVKAAVMNGNQGVKLSHLFGQVSQAPGTTQQAQNAAKSWLDNELTRLPPNPTSDDLLKLRSSIRAQGRQAKLSNDTMAQDKATIFGLADDQVTRALNSQLPPDAMKALQSADSQYGKYKIIENAVAASKDNVAGLTPQKVSQAIYNATPDPAYAKGGGGPLRDLAQAGTKTFQTVVPPNGATVSTLAGLSAGGYLHPVAAGAAGTGAAALTLTPTGRALAAGMTRPQQAVQKLTSALTSRIPQPVQNVGQQLLTRGAVGAGMPMVQQYAPQALAAALMMQTPQH